MAVQKIDYENKIGLQNDENVPNKNKVTDEDMNQIKSKVNNNADELSTAQQNIEDLQEGQGTASSEITSLENRVTTLEKDNTKNKQDIANKVDKVEGKGLSTEDYTTAEKEKLAGLSNYNDTEIKQDIQELQSDILDIKSEQETQNDLLERTQSALINIKTEKSSNINVKDSSDLNAKIDVFGISEQETRSGKNKFNIEKLTGTNITDKDSKTGAFKMSNCWGIIVMDNASLQEILKPNTQYKCIADITLLSKPDDLNASNSSQILSLYNNQDVVVVNMLFTSNKQEKDNWEVNTKKHLSTTFTTPADLTGFSMIGYNYRTERTTNEGSFKFENIMILEATENDESFEQYGASPSPEYPSEIENVTGNIDITVCNKNLFNCLKWLKMNHGDGYPVAITDNTNTAIEIIKETKNSIKYNQKSAYYGVLSEYIPVKKGQIFTLSFNYININRLFVTQYDKDKTRIKELNNTGNVNTTTFTVEQDGFITIAFSYSNATPNENTIEITNIQLEVGTVKTDYIENEQQTITFPLQEGQKLMKKDYPAENGIHHKRKQIELNGTENWVADNQASPSTCLGWKILVDDYVGYEGDFAPHGDILCSHFVDRNTYNNELDGISGGWGKWIFIKMKKEDLSSPDLTGFKAFLSEQKTNGTPVTIEYPLAEEEIEPYTEEQQTAYNQLQNAKTYKTVTNVFTENAEIEMEYIADTKTYVDNEINSIKEQINTINELLSTTNTSALLLNNLQTDLESEVL